MVRPVTASEVLLQQIAGSLERIEGLLQQDQTAEQPADGPVEVRGQAAKADAEPAPAKKTSSTRKSGRRSRPVSGD